MLFSNSRDSIKTVHILDTMLSSFNIFPKETAEDFSVYETQHLELTLVIQIIGLSKNIKRNTL